MNLSQILSKSSLNAYQKHLKNSGVPESTIKRKLASLRKFDQFAQKHHLKESVNNSDQNISNRIIIPALQRSDLKRNSWLHAKKGSLASERSDLAGISEDRSDLTGKLNILLSRLPSYINLAILVLFSVALGIFGYQQIFKNASLSQAYPQADSATSPNRYFSFQARLTDSSDNPITVPTDVRFMIYDDVSASGSANLWEELRYIDPDQDGIFSVTLGSESPINSDIFSENADLWLGVTVETDAEATPRQRIATVGYALNAETLQGFPPSASPSANEIPVLTQEGDLVLMSASPQVYSTSGTFGIKGQVLAITTDTGTNGDITIAPDGTGQILMPTSTTTQDSLYLSNANLTTGNLISGYVGNDTATGDLINLSSGSTPAEKFAVDQSGNLDIAGNFQVNGTNIGVSTDTDLLSLASGALTINGTLTSTGNINSSGGSILTGGSSRIDNSGNLTNIGTTQLNNLTYTWPSSQTTNHVLTTNGSGTLSWGDPASLASSSIPWIENDTDGTLYPKNSTLDVFFGGQASSSANFAFLNNASGTPTASISGNLTLNSTGEIQTTNNQLLTLGGNTTGDIYVADNVGIGTTTPTARLHVKGVADDQQLIVQANSTQTANLTEWQNNSGTVLNSILSGGQQYINVNKTNALVVEQDGVKDNVLVVDTTNGRVGVNTVPIGSDAFADEATLSIVAPASTRERILYAKVSDSSSYFSIFNTTSGGGEFLPMFAGYHSDSQIRTGLIFHGAVANSGTRPAVGFRASYNNYSSALTTRPLFGFGGGGSGNEMMMMIWYNGKVEIGNNIGGLETTNTEPAGQLNITGKSNIVQSIIKANSTQTANLTEWQNSSGTTLSSISGTGVGNLAGLTINSAYTLPTADGTTNYVLQTNGSGTLSWTDPASAAASSIPWIQNDTDGTLYPKNSTLDLLIGGQATSSAKFAFTNINSGTPTLTTNQASAINLVDATVNALNIESGLMSFDTSNGNVGIGTTTPSNPLHIYHATTDTVGLFESADAWGQIAIQDNADTSYFGTGNNLAFMGLTSGVSANNLNINTSGSVGIGTTGPDAKLDSLSTGEQLRLTYADGTTYTSFTTNSGGDLTIAPTGGDVALTGNLDVSGTFAAGTSNAFNIDATGNINTSNQTIDWTLSNTVDALNFDTNTLSIDASNNRVGIGYNTPSYALHVVESDTSIAIRADQNITGQSSAHGIYATTDGSNTNNYAYYGSVSGGTTNWGIYLTGEDNNYFSGSVGIGTTSPSQELELVGDIELETTTSNDTGVIYKGSDRFIHNFSHPTGDTAIPTGHNTFLGIGAGNFSMGSTATQTWHGSNNHMIGHNAFWSNTTGYGNNGIGTSILSSNTTGYYNTAMGNSALSTNTTGIRNIAIGRDAGKYLSDGSSRNEDGRQSIFIGVDSKANSASNTNQIVIGYDATSLGSNTTVIGNSSTTTSYLAGNLLLSADQYLNWGSTTGSTGYGLRDNSGAIEYKDSGDSWTSLDSLSSAANAWTYSSPYLYPSNATDLVGIGTTTTSEMHGLFTVSGGYAGNALAVFNETNGNDIIAASASGTTRFRVDNDGYVYGQRFADTQNSAYYLDPAAGTNSLVIAGAIASVSDADITINAGTGTVIIGTGTGKLNAGTVDPPYTINGEKYATYLSSMIGIKEEVTGSITTQYSPLTSTYSHIIDFTSLTTGSDLWLFTQATDLKNQIDDLVVLLSPSGNTRAWYTLDRERYQLTINTSQPTTVSYRLTAPRFDASSWANTRDDSSIGFVLDNQDYWGDLPSIPSVPQTQPSFISEVFYQVTADIASFKTVIAESISTLTLTASDKIISPLIETDTLAVQTIKPLESAQPVVIEADTEINGTLTAEEITSPTITSLREKIADLADQYNQQTATASASTAPSTQDIIDLIAQAQTATESGNITLDSLTASFGFFSDYLAVLGNATITDLEVTNTLTADSISTLADTLYLQPSGVGAISFLAGLVTFDSSGLVVIDGDLVVTGLATIEQIETNKLTAAEGYLEKLTLGSDQFANLLEVTDASGSSLASINSSGSAQFKDVLTQGLIIATPEASSSAIATSSASITTNATAGKAILPANQTEFTIYTPHVTSDTLTYVTPIGDSNNQVLYVKSKQTCESSSNPLTCQPYFTVAINQPLEYDLEFNWWTIKLDTQSI